MKKFDNFLQQFPNYNKSIFNSVLPFVKEKELLAGEYFVKKGMVCNDIAFIEKGLVRLFYYSNGKEITSCFCKENTLTTAYQSLITKQQSEIAIQAIEDCKLIVLAYDDLQKLYKQNIYWQQVGRMAAEMELIEITCHNKWLNNLSATEKYLQILENNNELIQRVPLNYLASYLQIAPETLSRIRNKISRT